MSERLTPYVHDVGGLPLSAGRGVPWTASADPLAAYEGLPRLYVDGATGSDANAGTEALPLATIREGLDQARAHRDAGNGGMLVLIRGGTYPEEIVQYMGGGSAVGKIVMHGYPGETVVMSGSDRWDSGWTDETGGVWSHSWTYDWGTAENPWSYAITIGELARRSELVVVNDVNMNQTMDTNPANLAENTFFVDEVADLMYLRLPAGMNPATEDTQVGIRKKLLRTQSLHNVTWKNVTFTRSASDFASSTVNIVDQNDCSFEDCFVTQNGNGGLAILGDRSTVKNTVVSNNGGEGIMGQQSQVVLIEDVTANGNNWRGDRGDFYYWAVGHKFLHVHDLTIRRFTAENNFATGLWLDSDTPRAVLEDVTLRNNYGNGLYLEAIQGPLWLEGGEISGNGDAGIMLATIEGLTMRNIVIRDNTDAQLRLTGDATRTFNDMSTDTDVTAEIRDWDVQGVTLAATGAMPLVTMTWSQAMFDTLRGSTVWNGNTYHHPDDATCFQIAGGSWVDFAGWQTAGGWDASSAFSATAYGGV